MNRFFILIIVIFCTFINKSNQQSCSYAQFIEFNGNDLPDASFIVSTPLECCTRCIQTASCSAWSWYANNGNCRLKSSMGSDLRSNNLCNTYYYYTKIKTKNENRFQLRLLRS